MKRLMWLFVAMAFAFVAIAPEAFAAPRVPAPAGIEGQSIVAEVAVKKKVKKAKKKKKAKKAKKCKKGKKCKKARKAKKPAKKKAEIAIHQIA